MKKTKSLYHTSMVVLYMVLRFGWTLYNKYQESFAEFSEDYTEEYGDAQLALVNKAQEMLDASQRRGTVTQQGTELDETSADGLLFWKKLRRYIIKAVPGKDQKAAIRQAGGAHFKKARNGVRTEITELLTAGQTYLETNAALLTDKGKMPASFALDYNKVKAAYDLEHIEYGAAKGDATDGTVDKVEANNNLYKTVQLMFGDAQVVFDDQKSIAKQFTYAAVKRLVTKNMGGIHFTILNVSEKPVTTAIITTDESGEGYPVNTRGVASVIMRSGVHSITVAAEGFTTYTGIVKVDAGVKHRVKIELKKQTVPEQTGPGNEAAPAEVVFTGETQLEQ